jgi:hypothetical protein
MIKDDRIILFPIFGFKNDSAFYSALGLKNKTSTTYEAQWKVALTRLPQFCKSKDIRLADLFSK